MRIAMAQLDPTIGDIGGSLAKIRQAVAEARQHGAGLVIFPELAVTGYPPGIFYAGMTFWKGWRGPWRKI